ncbi:MAG: ComEC/Rec2 family competence protein [Pseudomonadota bacterium]
MRDPPYTPSARGRATAVALKGRVRAWIAWHTILSAVVRRVHADAQDELVSGRLILWLPVAFAAGVLVYFSAEHEPSLLAALLLAIGLSAACYAARARPLSFAVLLALSALAWGFAIATLQTARITRPVLVPPPVAVRLLGHVEGVEHRPNADRMLLRVASVQGKGLDPAPALVRLSVPKGSAPPPGTPVSQLARLLPPLAPAQPGAHDFGRAPWFEGIDAVGYGMGRPKIIRLEGSPPWSVRLAAATDHVRRLMADRIRASLAEPAAGIAVALVTGDRSGVSPAIEDSMRSSGLTHVLSISGLHMALVAGTLFALVRAVLALSPALALGFPVKACAAVAALAGSAFYLLLSGNDVPAQRSFTMTALVLLGVLVGRPSLSLRTVGVAALVVFTLAPVSLLEAGTQMSFAATLALVAAYEGLQPLRGLRPPDGMLGRLGFKVAVFFGALALTSLVAGLATGPYGALHFQRLAPYGLLANLAAMPAVSLLVMPFGLLGVLLLPFGLDGLAWPVMGAGISVMTAVSDHVAALPGAVLHVSAIGVPTALAATVCLFCLCLFRGSLLVLALPPALLAVALAGEPPRPDVLISADGRTVAVRDGQGRYSIAGASSNRMVVSQWLTRDADPRGANDKSLAGIFICDRAACIAPLPGGGRVILPRKVTPAALACTKTDIIVAPAGAPGCAGTVYDGRLLARTGALALYRGAEGWREVPTRDPRVQRPWMAPLSAPPAPSVPPAAFEEDGGTEIRSD